MCVKTLFFFPQPEKKKQTFHTSVCVHVNFARKKKNELAKKNIVFFSVLKNVGVWSQFMNLKTLFRVSLSAKVNKKRIPCLSN